MQRRNPHQQRYATPASLLAHALAAPLLLLTACAPTHAPSPIGPTPTTPPPSRRTTDAQTEKKLTAQVESALKAFSSEGSSMVESGVERVSDGIHTRPTLSPGASYKLIVVCAGTGAAEIEFTPADAGPKSPVPCDQSAVVERLLAPRTKEPLRLGVRAEPGATGMVAWQINKVAR